MGITSHEYAKKMQQLAEFLLSRPEFPAEGKPFIYFTYYDREPLLAAVRAMGAGEKKFSDTEFKFIPANTPEGTYLQLDAARNKVCRLIKPAEYDCEPLLSTEEFMQATD